MSARPVPGARPAFFRERRAPRHVQRGRKPLGVAPPREHVGDFFVFLARIREPRAGPWPTRLAPIRLRDDVGFRFVELSVGGFVPLSQAFLARLALREVGFSRAAATAMMASRLPRRMLYEHQCCDLTTFVLNGNSWSRAISGAFSHSEGTPG